MKVSELEPPEAGEEQVYISAAGAVIKIRIHQDPDAENPSDNWDGQGKFHSFSTKHTNFLDIAEDVDLKLEELSEPVLAGISEITDRHLAAGTLSEMQAEISKYKQDNGVCTGDALREALNDRFGVNGWMQLGYFEHGECLWFPMKGEIPSGVEFMWDGVRFAGVWELDQGVKDNLVDIPEDELMARMIKYCAGCCDTYSEWCNGHVYGYAIDFNDDEESCWGYYGSDHTKSGLWDAILDHFEYAKITEVKEATEVKTYV